MGSTVNERRIASLNLVRASLSRNSSSREVTKLAVPDAGSRRQSSASRRGARSKAPRAIRPSNLRAEVDGLIARGAFDQVANWTSNQTSKLNQILNQRSRYSISRRL